MRLDLLSREASSAGLACDHDLLWTCISTWCTYIHTLNMYVNPMMWNLQVNAHV